MKLRYVIQKIKKHTKEIVLLLLGLSLFWIGLWQLDLLCAPYVWADKKVIEVLPFWYMLNTEAYVMFCAWIMIGLMLVIVAFWLWD